VPDYPLLGCGVEESLSPAMNEDQGRRQVKFFRSKLPPVVYELPWLKVNHRRASRRREAPKADGPLNYCVVGWIF